jgi:hypothetical protein
VVHEGASQYSQVVCNDELIVLMGEQAKEKKPMTKFH